MMVTLDDLYNEAIRFLWDNYGLSFNLPIDIEEDFVTEEGAYEHTVEEPIRIMIAEFVMQFADDEVIYDVLRHELVHHALHVRGEPFFDGHPNFEAELKRLGVGSTGTSMIGLYHLYECECCGEEIPHYTRVKEEEAKKLRTYCCTAGFRDKRQQAVFDGKRRLY